MSRYSAGAERAGAEWVQRRQTALALEFLVDRAAGCLRRHPDCESDCSVSVASTTDDGAMAKPRELAVASAVAGFDLFLWCVSFVGQLESRGQHDNGRDDGHCIHGPQRRVESAKLIACLLQRQRSMNGPYNQVVSGCLDDVDVDHLARLMSAT